MKISSICVALVCVAWLAGPVKALREVDTEAKIADTTRLHDSIGVVGLFDSKDRPDTRSMMPSIFRLIEDDPDLTEHKMEFFMMDMRHSPSLKYAMELTSHTGVYVLIGNYQHYFKEFDKLSVLHTVGEATAEDLAKAIKDWLLYRVRKLHRAIRNQAKLEHRIEKHKLIALYLGHKRSLKEQNVFKLAFEHPHFPIYRVHNRSLSQEFYRNHTGRDLGDQEVFCILRHSIHMNEFEKEVLHCIKATATYRRYVHFFNSESHPKLLTNEDVLVMGDRVINHGHKLFLFAHSNATDPAMLHDFRRAVHKLPKSFVYAALDLDQPLDEDRYYSFLLHLPTEFTPGLLYAIQHDHLGKKSWPMEAPITQANIIKFVHEFYKDHSHQFHHKDRNVIERHLNPVVQELDSDL
jgi:hypothetical protein